MNQGIGEYENYISIPTVGLVKLSELPTTPAVDGQPCPAPEMKAGRQANGFTMPSIQLSEADRRKINPIVFFMFSGPMPIISEAKIGSCTLYTKELLSPNFRLSAYVSQACSYQDSDLSTTVYLSPDRPIELEVPVQKVKGMRESTSSDLLFFDFDSPLVIAKGAANASGTEYDGKFSSKGAVAIDGNKISPGIGESITGIVGYEQGKITSFSTVDPSMVYCIATKDGAHFCTDASNTVTILLEHNSYMAFNGDLKVFVAAPYGETDLDWRNGFDVKPAGVKVLPKSDVAKRCLGENQIYWQQEHDQNSYFYSDACDASGARAKFQYSDIVNKSPLNVRDPSFYIREYGHSLQTAEQEWISFDVPSFEIPVTLPANKSIKDYGWKVSATGLWGKTGENDGRNKVSNFSAYRTDKLTDVCQLKVEVIDSQTRGHASIRVTGGSCATPKNLIVPREPMFSINIRTGPYSSLNIGPDCPQNMSVTGKDMDKPENRLVSCFPFSAIKAGTWALPPINLTN